MLGFLVWVWVWQYAVLKENFIIDLRALNELYFSLCISSISCMQNMWACRCLLSDKIRFKYARPQTPLGEMSPHVLRFLLLSFLLLATLIPMKMSCRRSVVFLSRIWDASILLIVFIFILYSESGRKFSLGLIEKSIPYPYTRLCEKFCHETWVVLTPHPRRMEQWL